MWGMRDECRQIGGFIMQCRGGGLRKGNRSLTVAARCSKKKPLTPALSPRGGEGDGIGIPGDTGSFFVVTDNCEKTAA